MRNDWLLQAAQARRQEEVAGHHGRDLPYDSDHALASIRDDQRRAGDVYTKKTGPIQLAFEGFTNGEREAREAGARGGLRDRAA
jgi:hypothetical protein